MATQKLRKFDPSSAGVTIPLDDLRREGVVVSEPGEEIELESEQLVFVDRVGSGEWKLTLADSRRGSASD
jgi:hypothetical protein